MGLASSVCPQSQCCGLRSTLLVERQSWEADLTPQTLGVAPLMELNQANAAGNELTPC